MERNREGRRAAAMAGSAVPSVTRRPRVKDASGKFYGLPFPDFFMDPDLYYCIWAENALQFNVGGLHFAICVCWKMAVLCTRFVVLFCVLFLLWF